MSNLQSIAHFNGSNNYIEVPYKKELNPAQFTLSCWAKVEGGSGQWRSPVTCRTARGSSALGGYILYAGNNNKWQFWTGNGGWVVLQGANVELNTWTHVAATYDGSTMKLYINGELSGNLVPSKILINSQYPLRIGAGMTEGNPTYFFNGKIAEVRLWDKARSQEQIQELMHQRLKGDEQGLVAYWPLDQESGTSAEDKTGKGNPGTLHGATWAQETLDILKPSAPETEQTSEQSVLTFNGRNNYVQIPITQWEASTFSVELWAKASKAQPGYASVISNSNTTQRGSFQIDVGGGYYRLLHSVQVQIGKLAQEWQHLAVTYDGKTVKTYLNGEEKNTKAIDSMQTVFKVYKLGRNRSNNTYFAGQLSEVRIWDRARTAEEIQGGMGHRLAGDEPGLVAYFPLNKGSGKTVQDHTNPDREGTIYGATWAEETLDFLQPYAPPEEQSSEPPVLQPETIQAIASFNGSNQYIEVPYKKELNPAQFTVSCWAKVEGGSGQWRSPVTCRTAKGSSALGGYLLYAGNNNKWQFWTGNGGWVAVQGADVELNTWTHVAATYDGSTMKLYINGKLSGKPVPSKILINSKYPLRIGAGITEGNPGFFFNGKIAEVRVWNKARSPEQIQELMHQRLKGDEQGLVAYWPLDQESGTSAEDKTGKGNPGTLHGATWAQENLDFIKPSAPQEEQSSEQPVLMFDGQDDHIATTLDAQPSALPATTWEAWVKPTRNINHWENILSTDNQGWDRSIGTNGGQFGIYHGKEAWRPVKADIDQWQHIAVVYGADKHIKFYKNGTEYLYSGQSTIGSTKLPFHIGRSAWNPKNCFQGFITEVRVWDSARTAAEIQNNMHCRLTGNEPGLVGYWPLNEGQGTTGTDRSNQGHDGTINGATWETSADLELAAAPERQTAPLNRPVLAFANTKKPTDYVILNPFNSFPAQRLTVELWLKTNHKNPGTPISYSAKSSINAFLLFDYRSLHPHVCDAKINSAIAFNDGQWHHCAMTWDSSTGKIELYKDGESVFSGTLAKGKKIPNGGALILGQEQDSVAGSFDVNQAFRGQMSEVRIWDGIRSPQEIEDNRHCALTGNESGLVLYWPLDEGTGTTVTDKSGHGHDGTTQGTGVTWETSDLPLTSQEETAPTESATAKSSAISFDGTDDHITIALNEPETEVTHEFWFKTDAPNCGLFSVVKSPDWGGHDRHLYLSGGNLKTRIWSNEIISSSGLNLADNAWHHVAHVFGASIGGQKVYIDGQLVASGTKHTSDFNTQDLIVIAYSRDAQQRYFQGQIAEVRIWKITRSPDEIQQTMHQQLTGEEEGLIGYWPLNDGSGTTIADKTSQNHPGTLHGGTWTEEALDFIQPSAPQTEETSEQSALMFDGVDDYVSLPIDSIPEGKEITISFWAKGGSSLPKQCSVFFAYPTPNFDPSKGKIVYTVNIHLPWSNSNIYFDCGSDGNTYNRIYKAAQATDFKDKWTHWAFTLNASTGKMAIYLNGDSWCEGNNKTLSIPQAGEVKLGSGYGFYHGSLSEVRVWDRELSATEIKDTMSTRLTGTESGLVSYWPLDEGSGTTAEDKSGNNHHGTIHGATWESSSLELSPAPTVVSAPEEPSDATSTETTILTFDGVDDYVDIPANPTLDVTNDFTIEAWIKPEVLGKRIVDKNIGGKNEGFTFDTYPQNLRFINKGIGFTSRTPLTTGTWQHVAVTFKHEANGAKLYINGEEDNTATPSRVGTVTKLPVRLGSQADKLGSLFKGEIAEVRIWNRVRSPEEIKASMNQQLTGEEEGLIGYWPLNEGTGTTAEDKTSNGNTGTVHGGTWGTSDLSLTPAPKPEFTTEETEEPLEPESTAEETEVLQPETLQSVASFDGTNDYIEVPYKKELNPAQFTLSCWAKVEGGQGQWRSPVTCRTAKGSSALGGYILYAGNNNKWQFWTGNGGWVTLQGADVVLNTWTHVAATYDGSTMKLYINGELSGNPVPSKILINSQYPLRIGAGVTEGNPGYFFNGKIAEVRLWDKARSPEQIQELMHQRLKGDEQGLVAYWPLDQESGTSAEDKTGNGNPGTLHGATWAQENLDFIKPSAPQEEQSSEQPVLMFDGENDYIATTLDTQPSALPATTWEAWVKPTRNINHWDMILSTDDGGWDRFVGINGGQFRVSHGKEAWNPVNADINQWQHIAVVYSADKQIKFYKNGTEYVYSGQSSIGSTKLPFHIGRSAGNTSQCFQGLMTEVRVWDSARTAAEIQNDMHCRLTGNEPGLVGYWPLNEGQGTTGTDRSNQGHDGTINGATWESSGLQLSPAPTVEPAPEQLSESTSTEDMEREEALSPASLMFDGIDDSVAIPNAEWETSAFSVELWAKASQNQSNYAGLFSSSNDPAASGSCQIDAMGGFYRFYHSEIQVRIAKVNQEWQHLVVTYDGQAVQTYLNGEPQNSKAVNAMNTVFRDYILGRNRNSDKYFAGELSDVRIWNKALTADEVQAAMGYRLTGDESGLVAYWPLDEGKGDAIGDRTGNTPPGVMNGTTWQTTDLELSGSDEGLDASPEIPQKPQPTSKKRIPLDRSVTSITVLKSDEDFGGRPETLHGKSAKSKKRKKRKKQSKYLSPYEKYVRKVAKRQEEATHTYVERHKRSNRKKKNGWLKDFAKNYSKSVSKLF